MGVGGDGKQQLKFEYNKLRTAMNFDFISLANLCAYSDKLSIIKTVIGG